MKITIVLLVTVGLPIVGKMITMTTSIALKAEVMILMIITNIIINEY